jgi:hypothetical protein
MWLVNKVAICSTVRSQNRGHRENDLSFNRKHNDSSGLKRQSPSPTPQPNDSISIKIVEITKALEPHIEGDNNFATFFNFITDFKFAKK